MLDQSPISDLSGNTFLTHDWGDKVGGESCAAGRSDRVQSRRLGSLWDMLGKYAWQFFILSRLLDRLHERLGIAPPAELSALSNPYSSNYSGGIAGGALGNALATLQSPASALPLPPLDILDSSQRDDILGILGLIDGGCVRIGITSVGKDIKRATDYVQGASRRSRKNKISY